MIVNKSAGQASIGMDADADDKALVEQAQAGNADAFQQLFERYYRRGFQLALGIVRNPEDAQDVVQDAFIKAHKNLHKFEGKSSFFTWMYRIVTNLCIDHIRKRKRSRQVNVDDTSILVERAGAESDNAILPTILGQDPGRALMRKEIRSKITEALEQLSENHRAVLVMREVDGLSYNEMADIMQCSKGTIMSRLFHARKNMQKILTDAEEQPSKAAGNS